MVATGQGATSEDLVRHCAAHLAPYKVPRHFFFVDDMPKNSAGKILKHALVKAATGGTPGP